MAQSCPINFQLVDGTITRLNTLSVSVVLTLFLVSHNPMWMYLLFFDFMMRLYGCKTLSFSYLISTLIKDTFNLKTHNVDAAAKRLAAHFGLFFVLMLVVAVHLHMTFLIYLLAGLFLVCLLTDLLFDYCVGCKIYFILNLFFPKMF